MLDKRYEGLELSTQLLIQEALARGVQVDVIDGDDHFVRLKKGDNIILDGFGAGLTWAAIVLKWSK